MTVPLIILAAFSLFAGMAQPGLRHPQGEAARPLARARVQGGDRGRGRLRPRQRRAWAEHLEWPLAMGGMLRVPRRNGRSPTGCTSRRRASPRRAWPRRSRASTSSCSTSGASTSSTTRRSSSMVDSLADTSAALDRGDRRRHPRALHGAGRRRVRHGPARAPERRRPRLRRDDGRRPRRDDLVLRRAARERDGRRRRQRRLRRQRRAGRRLRVPLGRGRRRQARQAGLRAATRR